MEDYLLFERFSLQEQRGLQKSNRGAIIASLLSGRSNSTNPANQIRDSFKRESELGKTQEVKYTASDLEETHLTMPYHEQ